MARIRVRCGVCNARLKVPEAVCGGVIRCHHCKAKILVPSRSVQGTKTIQLKTSDAGFDVKEQPWLRVQCDCGKVIKAPIEWAGKMGHCPRCGKGHKMPAADSAISSTLMRVKRVEGFAKRDGDEFTLDDSAGENPTSNMTMVAAPLEGDGSDEETGSNPSEDMETSELVSELSGRRDDDGDDDKDEDDAKDQGRRLKPPTLEQLDKISESSTIHDPMERIRPRDKNKPEPKRSVRPIGRPKRVEADTSGAVRPAPTPKVKGDGKSKEASGVQPVEKAPEEPPIDFKKYIETSGISLPNIGGFDPDIIEEDDSKYLRVVCSHCGKRVKAPPELSGKTGVCPACGGTIAMPIADAGKFGPVVKLEGISTDDSLVKALDEIAPTPEEDVVGTDDDGGEASGSGLLNAAQSEKQLMTIEGMTSKEWEEEKQRRAMSIMRYRRGYVVWVFSRATGGITAIFDRVRAVPHSSPAIAFGVMSVLFLASLGVSISQMPEDYKTANRGLIIPYFYYDGETGVIVTMGDKEARKKIEKAYQNESFETKNVLFKATVYSCGACSDVTQLKVSYIEKWTPEAREALVKRDEAMETPEFSGYSEADAKVKAGTFVATVPKFDWQPMLSPEGQAITQTVVECSSGTTPILCFPEIREGATEQARAESAGKTISVESDATAKALKEEADKAVENAKAAAAKKEQEAKEAAKNLDSTMREKQPETSTPEAPAVEGAGQ